MKNILILNMVALATAFSPFMDEFGMNYFFIALMVLSIFITGWHFLKPNKKNWAVYLLPFTLLFSGILHYDSFRISSYLYGVLFVLFFISNLYLIKNSRISIDQYQKFLKALIYTYFCVLVIQQIQYLSGYEDFFNRIYAKEFSFNVLATEPSYAAITIIFLFYIYIQNQEAMHHVSYGIANIRKEKMLCFVFLYQILTIGSSFGILFLLFLLLTFLKEPKYFAGIFIMTSALIFIGIENNFVPLIRVIDTIVAINFSSDDYSDLVYADHSAAVRIIPLLMFLKDLDFYTFFGKGMDFSLNYFLTVMPGIEEGSKAIWLIPSFIIDYGFVTTLLLIVVIFTNGIQKFFSFSTVILFFTLLNTSFNSQLFWMVITLLAINKHFIKNASIKNVVGA